MVIPSTQITDPTFIDVWVSTGFDTVEFCGLGVDRNRGITSSGALATDRVDFVQKPNPTLKPKILCCESPYGADIGEISRIIISKRAIVVGF